MRIEARGEAGFTLIEVLVVLVIFGIVLALLAAQGPWRGSGAEARMAASQVAQAMRLGRSRAIAVDRTVAVVLDLPTHRLSVDGRTPTGLPASVVLGATMADGADTRQRAVFMFSPDGSATGGRIDLALRNQRLAVVVDWMTGRVSVAGR